MSSVTYIPKPEELVYTSDGHSAKMHLKPGTTLITWTEDCGDGAVKSPDNIPSKVMAQSRAMRFYVFVAGPILLQSLLFTWRKKCSSLQFKWSRARMLRAIGIAPSG